MRSRALFVEALFVVAALGTLDARAAELVYRLEIPERRGSSFVVTLEPRHAGTLVVEAAWSGSRPLSFRLEGPGDPRVKARRTGPSPQSLQVRVDEASLNGQPWKLLIRALPDRRAANGTLTVRLPEPIAPEVPEPAFEDEPGPPGFPPELEPWARPVATPPEASIPVARLFESVEGLRRWIIDDEAGFRRDACGWQSPTLRYLTEQRDGIRDGAPRLAAPTSRYLQRLAAAIRQVEELRSGNDPILSGPAPEERTRYRAWLAVRRQKIKRLEAELDWLAGAIRDGFVDDLRGERWPQRLTSCLMACERHFEQRVRLGEDSAANRELAADQWDGFLAVAETLEALAAFDP